MASTTYRSSTSANTAATPASSLTLNIPAGCVANDVLLACIGVAGGTGASITPPSGWTLVSTQAQGTNMLMNVYWYLATGYDASSFAWTFDSARQASGFILDYSGAYGHLPPSSTTTSTATAGSVTVTTAPASSYETGMGIQFFGAFNTTGTTTMTSGGGGYTQRVDTCTTATAFIEVAAQDLAKGLGLGSISTKAANIAGQTATSIAISVFIDDQRANFYGLAEDEFQEGSFTAAVSATNTKTIATNFPNELLLAFICIQKGTTTVSSISGGTGLTWVNVGRANTNAGSVELWRAFSAAPQSFTATITYSASTLSGNHMFVGIIGADQSGTNGSGAIGSFVTGTSTTAAPTINLTTTRNNSWVWAATNDPTGTTAPVMGASQTLIRNISDATNTCQSWMQRQNAFTPQTGTTVTMNATAPSTDSCNILAVEILPAIHYNLGITGIG